SVTFPQLAVRTIGGSKEESAVKINHDRQGVSAERDSRVSIFYEGGPFGGTVSLPHLASMHGVVCREKHSVLHPNQAEGVAAVCGGIDIFEQNGSSFGSVAFPQLVSIGAVTCRKNERAIQVYEVRRIGVSV